MIIIKCVSTTAGLTPETPIPSDAICVTCDGTEYTVYQPGDDLPPEPDYGDE